MESGLFLGDTVDDALSFWDDNKDWLIIAIIVALFVFVCFVIRCCMADGGCGCCPDCIRHICFQGADAANDKAYEMTQDQIEEQYPTNWYYFGAYSKENEQANSAAAKLHGNNKQKIQRGLDESS